MSFGPGNAFGAFAPSLPSSTRAPRRVNSSGSFKDPSALSNGPQPIDHPTTPSFGSWGDSSGQRERENSHQSGAGAAVNGHSPTQHNSAGDSAGHQQRSFSSILSPSLAANASSRDSASGAGGGHDSSGKPFVYSRAFLLSLYDSEKCKKRPIELMGREDGVAVRNDSASSEADLKPWALKEWRDGEKELFATSIHPPTGRIRSQHGQSRSSAVKRDSPSLAHREAPGTLDLSTLGVLPRDRDRALGGAGSPAGSPLVASAVAPGERDLAAARRTRVGSGTPSNPLASSGILGGVLGNLGGGGGGRGVGGERDGDTRNALSVASGGQGGKEVWQGGRWRRQANEKVEEAESPRPSAFGARRFPVSGTDDLLSSPISSRPGTPHSHSHSNGHSTPISDGVRAAWDEDDDSSLGGGHHSGLMSRSRSAVGTPSRMSTSQQLEQPQEQQQHQADLHLDQHASSILGSLALDDDPLPSSGANANSNAFPSAPPGLPAAPPAQSLKDHAWQYRDPSGTVQGPFPPSMMHDWYRQQFFTLDLKVRRTGEREFETLENLVRRSADADSPFLSAPLQTVAALPPPSQATSQWPTTPLDQFANPTAQHTAGANTATQRAFGSFYEPFGGAQSPGGAATQFGAPQQQQSQQLDPWGAPLPSTNGLGGVGSSSAGGGWGDASSTANLFSAGGAYGQQQTQFPGQQQQGAQSPFQQQAQNPVDIFRQLTQQQPQQQEAQQQWNSTPQMQFQQQPQQPQQPAAGQWSSLLPSRVDNLAHPSQQQQHGQGSPAMSPIGPPQPQQQQPAPVSPWATTPAAESLPPPIEAPKEFTQIAKTSATEKVAQAAREAKEKAEHEERERVRREKEDREKKEREEKQRKEQQERERKEQEEKDRVEKEKAESAAAVKSAPSPAPWSATAPSAAAPTSTNSTGPSLREIQEAEAREAAIRKTARVQAAQANIRNAQLLAAQEAAEQLPASAQWGEVKTGGASSSSSAPGAPWTAKPAVAKTGKTLKEIQEEEERRKKALAAQQAQSAAGIATGVRGYAGSIGQAAAAKANPGPSWTTVAVKAAPTPSAAPAARPIIPGLNLPASSTTASRTLPAKPAPASAPVAAVRAPAPTPAPATSSIIRSVSVNGVQTRSNGAQQYDAENPPPPSAELMKWTKDALKGLTVPMDEFIQMLLSFPLDASPDVLEIISDSVYANSSTLDGRRFANEYAARRKMDVAARYPQIVMSKTVNRVGGGKPTSMAEALKSQPVAKTPEWSVKVAGGKKGKKAGK